LKASDLQFSKENASLVKSEQLTLDTQQNKPKESSMAKAFRQPTLTEENFRLVLGKIRETCRVKSYITTEELEYETGLDRDGLLEILRRMEEEGKILQYHHGCWKPAS